MTRLTKERKEMYEAYVGVSLIIIGILTVLLMLAVWGAIEGVRYRGACGAAAVLLGSVLILTTVLQSLWLFRREMEHRFGQIIT